jgi:hypothetical protein
LSEWRRLSAYCGSCAAWSAAIPHQKCQAAEGAIALDAGEFLLACGACHEVWLAEGIEAACPACGHIQIIEFRDDRVHLQDGDQPLASDGTVVYVLLRSGVLLITRRGCIGAGDA